MPCSPQKARRLLKEKKAVVKHRTPFTIKLVHGSSGYKQECIAGMDTGSKHIGSAVISNSVVVYQASTEIRNDVSKKMTQRAMYRRTRRGRKTRYRKPRFLNRGKKGKLAPSLISKIDSHFRERDFINSILPISKWKVETASFNIHKISDPDVTRWTYQSGQQKDFYNTKAFILNRDGYKCLSGRKIKHSDSLHVHHIVFRSNGGTDTPSNLVTLCSKCHDDLHKGKFELKVGKSRTKHATEIGIVKSRILKSGWKLEETFGYETKFKREQVLQLSKTHYNDAVAICVEDGEYVNPYHYLFNKKHVSKGDYQLTKGARSEKKMPVGKLFGLRKFDLVSTIKGTGFVKGKRSSGYFALMDITGKSIVSSVSVKKNCTRIAARKTTLITMGSV